MEEDEHNDEEPTAEVNEFITEALEVAKGNRYFVVELVKRVLCSYKYDSSLGAVVGVCIIRNIFVPNGEREMIKSILIDSGVEPGIANFSIDNERTKDECRRIAVSALTRDGHLTDVANDDFVLYSMASEVSSGGNSDSPRSNALFETLLSLRFGTVDVGEWERVAGSIPTFSRLVDRAQYVAAATLLALHGLSHL